MSYQPIPTGNSQVIRTSSWMVTMLLLAIPILNIIMLLVWAFGSGVNLNKRNLSRAYLLLFLIVAGISLLIFLLTLAAASGQ
ncbi:hypothetical protein ACLBWT_03395 [Paenibacillus sp. D51F]